ncbi:MAG: hypothetical protein ACRD0P_35540 [Stackebrandtia sp.]
MQTATKSKNRTRRLASRVAVAGALVVVPLSALAVPAFADAPGDTPSAVAIDHDRPHGDNHPGDHHPGDPGRGDRHHDHQPAPGLPPHPPVTGSAG